MYPNERIFVDKFLSQLIKNGVKQIPFHTDAYSSGIQAMKKYFDKHCSELDSSLLDIRLVFLNSGQGDFSEAIMSTNGGRISLQNPALEVATIKMTRERADYSLNDNDYVQIPESFMEDITKAFCEAANITVDD